MGYYMPLPLVPIAVGTAKYGLPVIAGAMTYRDRISKGQTQQQAILGAAVETGVGLAIPGIGSSIGKGLGIAKAATWGQGARRFVGTSIASVGASQYAGFQTDRATGVNDYAPLTQVDTTYQPIQTANPAIPNQGGATSYQSPNRPIGSYKPPQQPNSITPYAWAGVALAGAGTTYVLSRGRMGGKQAADAARALANKTPAGTQVATGVSKIGEGLNTATQGIQRGVQGVISKLPVWMQSAPSPASVASRIGDAIETVDERLTAGAVPTPADIGVKIPSPAAPAAKPAANTVDDLWAYGPNPTKPPAAAAPAAAAPAAAAAAAAAPAAAAPAAKEAAKAAPQGLLGRARSAFVKAFSAQNISAEAGKGVVGALVVSPFLTRLGLRRAAVAAAPVAAAAAIVPTALTLGNRRIDAEYGTQAAWWDDIFFGGAINNAIGVKGSKSQELEGKLALGYRNQDTRLAAAEIQAQAQVRASENRSLALIAALGSRNPEYVSALANTEAGRKLGLQGLITGGGGGSTAPRAFYGPGLGPGGAKFTTPSVQQRTTNPAIQVAQIQAAASIRNAGGQERIASGDQYTRRYASDNQLKGIQAQTAGQERIASGDQYTRRYASDNQLKGIQAQTAGQVQIAAGNQATQRYVSDNQLQGVRTQTAGQVQIAAGNQYTQRYVANVGLEGTKVRVAGDLERQRMQSATALRTNAEDNRTTRYVSDRNLQGTMFRSNNELRGKYVEAGSRERVATIQTDGQVRVASIQTAGALEKTNLEVQGRNQVEASQAATRSYESDNLLRGTAIKAKADTDVAYQSMFGQAAAAQAAAAGAAQKAFIEADPEMATASTLEEIQRIKNRRALKAAFTKVVV